MSDSNSSTSGILLATVGVRSLTFDLAGLAMALAWIGFWLMIAFVHYQQGDLTATAVTGVGLTLPGLGLLLWRVTRHW